MCLRAYVNVVLPCALLQLGGTVLPSASDVPPFFNARTPLHWAAAEGDVTAVEILLTEGADLHAVDQTEQVALDDAVENGHLDVVKLLLRAGADPNRPFGCTVVKRTPLYAALDSWHLAIAGCLLDAGAQPDACGHSPLHIAAQRGYLSFIKRLLSAGADPNGSTASGHTPLHQVTLSYSHAEAVIKPLACAGADLDATDQAGDTPLNTAAYRGLHVVIAELLKRGATRYNGRDNRTYNRDMTRFESSNGSLLCSQKKHIVQRAAAIRHYLNAYDMPEDFQRLMEQFCDAPITELTAQACAAQFEQSIRGI